MSLAKVAVIIVNWHSEKLLAEVLAALNEQSRIPDQVVVVDNGSKEPLPLEHFNRNPASVIRMPGNAGFAVANNRALEQTTGADWIALLNPDAVPDRDWLRQLLAAAADHPEASAFGSKQLMADDPSMVDGFGDVYHVSGSAWRAGHGQHDRSSTTEVREIFSPCAAAAMYKRSALLEAGGFDEDFFCYFEDVDLGFRLRLLGHTLMLAPGAIVYHAGGGTSGGHRSDFAVYHGQRNLVWSYFKNMPTRLLFLYFFQHLLFSLVSIVYFSFKGQGSQVLRAKWDALRGLPGMLKKRAAIQSNLRVTREQVLGSMAKGLFAPYHRHSR